MRKKHKKPNNSKRQTQPTGSVPDDHPQAETPAKLPEDLKRSIPELVVLYEREPALRDIYVEGELDSRVIRWFLSELHIDVVCVYEVADIMIPDELVGQIGHSKGSNRSKLIALASELDKHLGNRGLQATCVVDADFDWILERRYPYRTLLMTDYSSMEMYLFDEMVFNKLFRLSISNFEYDIGTIMFSLSQVLRELFLIRLMNIYFIEKQTGSGLHFVSYEKLLSLKDGTIEFDADTYVTRYLCGGNNAAGHLLTEARQFIEEHRMKLKDDPRFQMHGHDFIDLLVWYVKNLKGTDGKIAIGMIEKSIYGFLEIKYLQTFPLFAKIQTRVSS